jgi:hypothetical protein
MFSDVNLLTMKKNALNGRLVIDILCEFNRGAKKK